MEVQQAADREELKCKHCSKVFTKKGNLNRHIRHVHNKEKKHACGVCQKKFSRKQHREYHERTCSKKVATKLEPFLRQAAFGGIFTYWTVYFPQDLMSYQPFELIHAASMKMKKMVNEHLEKYKRLKFNLIVHVIFEKATDPEVKTDPPVVFWTSPYTIWPMGCDIDASLKEAADELIKKIEDYEGIGSGWTIDHLLRMDIDLLAFANPLIGSERVLQSDWLIKE